MPGSYPYVPHQVVKPEKIVATAAVLLEQQLVVPAVFRREGIDQFKGAKDDTINVVVEGILPYRTYGWRNDRSTEIQFDTYSERKIGLTFGGDIYSAVALTDEQNDFDLNGWAKLARKQTEAIGRGLEDQATAYVRDAPYAVTLGVPENTSAAPTNLRRGLIRARATLNKLRAPTEGRTMLIGTDWETALLDDDKLGFGQETGAGDAGSALRNATIGQRYGFNFVVAPELDPTTAIAMTDSAFIFATGAPSVPQSVPFGASASYNGVALRWLRDYDMTRTTDRSLFNTYKGFRSVTDVLLGKDAVTGLAYVGEYEHFVRAIKLVLGGADVLPDPDGPDLAQKEFAAITGVAGPADGPTV